jgi:hypothetical protein
MFYRDGAEGFTGIIYVTAVQSFIIIGLIFIPLKIFVGNSTTSHFVKEFKIIGVIIMLSVLAVNYYKYKNLFESLHNKWQSEKSSQKSLNGLLVVFALVVPIAVIIYVSNY